MNESQKGIPVRKGGERRAWDKVKKEKVEKN